MPTPNLARLASEGTRFLDFHTAVKCNPTRANYVVALDALQKLKEIAAMDLGGAPDDYDVGDHRVFATADPERYITYQQAAQRAIELGGRRAMHTGKPCTIANDENSSSIRPVRWPVC